MEQGLFYTRTRSAAIRAFWDALDLLEKEDDAELDAYIRERLPARLKTDAASKDKGDGENDTQ